MPDITGFTEFVNGTEIEHGQHIISELLEIIIESDDLNMTVNEIEGDAVLFYKLGKVPSYEKIANQAISMFTKFHTHLKRYDHDRICQCGACAGASSLSLKIIAHTGELGFTTVNKQKKLYGKDLIVIHKLLKNNVDSKEYLLLSDELMRQVEDTTKSNLSDHFQELKEGTTEYEKIGLIPYQHFSLTPLLQKIAAPSIQIPPEKVSSPLRQEIFINKPLHEVYELLTNLKYRTEWNEGLDELLYDNSKINRNQVVHQCIVNDKLIDFETIRQDFDEGEVGFGERLLTVPPGVRSVTIYYKLTEDGKGTKLLHETHIIAIPIIGWLSKLIMSKVFSKTTAENLKAFVTFCEQKQLD